MSEQLLTILKLCLLALLYLFFLRVLRAVWVEVKGPPLAELPAQPLAPAPRAERAARPARAPKRRQPTLEIVEPASTRGARYPVTGEMTLGRASGCQVVVDDSFASQIHARVYLADGQVFVEDLGSTNGTYLNRDRVAGARVLAPGDQLQIGNTILELR